MNAVPRINDPSDSAQSYVEHAQEMNAIARSAMRIDTRDSTYIAKKISLGLSLQAAELAGKAILRSLGEAAHDIRARHRRHGILTLLRDAEARIRARPEERLRPYHHFLLWTPEINGQQFQTTIAAYLEAHFARGASAKARNYFYPDTPTYVGPQPIQALLVMVDHLIEVASAVTAAMVRHDAAGAQQAAPGGRALVR